MRFFLIAENNDYCDSDNETVIYNFNSNSYFNDHNGLLQLMLSDFLEYVKCNENEQTENEFSDEEIMITS